MTRTRGLARAARSDRGAAALQHYRAHVRLLLIADTHGALDPRLAEAVANADRVAHAGDVGDGVADVLASLNAAITVVAGNCDPADCGWPEAARLDLPGGPLIVVHGHQWPARRRHARLRGAYPEARVVVYGHSHRRAEDDSAAPLVVNPGAAGKTRAYGGPGALELDATPTEWRLTWHIFEPLSRR